MVVSAAAMATKAGRRSGSSGRTILVVEVGEEGAETLLAELASRGFPASILRGEGARKAAGLASDSAGDAGSSFSEAQIRLLLGGLSSSEIKVLWLLLRNVGNPVSDGDIYRELYGGKGPADSRAAEQAVRRLKRKLGPLGASIERQRGVGIRWNPGPGRRAGLSFDRIFRLFAHYRAAVFSFFLVAGFAAGWLLRAGTPARPASGAEELIPPPPPPAEAFAATEGMAVAPGHGPECAIDRSRKHQRPAESPRRGAIRGRRAAAPRLRRSRLRRLLLRPGEAGLQGVRRRRGGFGRTLRGAVRDGRAVAAGDDPRGLARRGGDPATPG